MRQWAGIATLVATTSLLAACSADDSPADKYAGSWMSACEDADLYAVDQPGQPLKSTYRLTLAKTDDHRLHFAMVYQVHPASGCTGRPLATHTNAATENTYVFDGTQRVDGVDADRITVNMAALGTLSNGGQPVVVDGIRYPADFFISSVHDNKDLIVLDGSGLRFGAGDAVDADGYPTTLDTASRLTRQ